ncbi:MAG: glycosyltransferase, partial [Synergistaceae bacterium]|nr:glycosyltransferase [Synergistaceae bacterium]
MISVVIATMNRAAALRRFSLASLLRQTEPNFEVIVWDASADDDTAGVCESLIREFEKIGSQLRYFKAPRKGSASQRNDGFTAAEGDIVFYIDDDCELSADAISSLCACFRSFPWLNGAGLPMLNKTPSSGNSSLIALATRLFGMKNHLLRRTINRYGGLSLPIKDLPGPAEWLSGGSMAFRK